MSIDELRIVYGPALSDLQARRDATYSSLVEHQRRLLELDNLIAGIMRIVNPTNPAVVVASKKYANISVRWAILDLLSAAGAPKTTADIAEALKEAGVVTKAANFTNNISAVLSSTMKGKGEVAQNSDGLWELTERGSNAISHIQASAEFRKRCPWFRVPSVAAPGTLPAKGGDPL
jgi:hypothetical protein